MINCFQENYFDILFLQSIMVNYMLTWEENLHDKRDDFNVPIMNFPFICSNIAAAMEYISLSWYDIPEHVVPIG
jgi:hypothetical protein